MVLTRELLEQRIKSMEAQRATFLANINACEGALMLLRQLLIDLESEDQKQEISKDGTDGGGQGTIPCPPATGTKVKIVPVPYGGMY